MGTMRCDGCCSSDLTTAHARPEAWPNSQSLPLRDFKRIVLQSTDTISISQGCAIRRIGVSPDEISVLPAENFPSPKGSSNPRVFPVLYVTHACCQQVKFVAGARGSSVHQSAEPLPFGGAPMGRGAA